MEAIYQVEASKAKEIFLETMMMLMISLAFCWIYCSVDDKAAFYRIILMCIVIMFVGEYVYIMFIVISSLNM